MSILASVTASLVSLLTHRPPHIWMPTGFFLTILSWIIHRLIYKTADTWQVKDNWREFVAHIVPTVIILLFAPCTLMPLLRLKK